MAFLLFWLGSSVFSVGMEAVNELRIVKELADMGYKLNMRKLIGLLQQMELENSRLFFLC